MGTQTALFVKVVVLGGGEHGIPCGIPFHLDILVDIDIRFLIPDEREVTAREDFQPMTVSVRWNKRLKITPDGVNVIEPPVVVPFEDVAEYVTISDLEITEFVWADATNGFSIGKRDGRTNLFDERTEFHSHYVYIRWDAIAFCVDICHQKEVYGRIIGTTGQPKLKVVWPFPIIAANCSILLV